MHSTDKIQQFIEARSKGHSCDYIATQIGVSRSTLFEWDKKYMPKIQRSKHEELGEQRRDSIDLLECSLGRGVTFHSQLGLNISHSLHNLNNIPLDRRILLFFKVQRELDRMTLLQRKEMEGLAKHLKNVPEDPAPDATLDDLLCQERVPEECVEPDKSDLSGKSPEIVQFPQPTPETATPAADSDCPKQTQESTESGFSENNPETVQLFPNGACLSESLPVQPQTHPDYATCANYNEELTTRDVDSNH